jgi:glycosyltransferase involved in cell wall biosynthesis
VRRVLTTGRPLRVALLTTSVEFGGIEGVVLNLLQHMDSGVEFFPVVFTRTDTGENGFFERLRSMRIQHATLYVNSLRPELIANPVANLAQLVALFRKQRFDLIHSHGYRADLFALAASKLCNLPLVATCHGFTPTDQRLRLYCAVDARLLRWFTRVIAVSGRMKEDLIEYGVHADRIRVITNAVAEVSAGDRARTGRDMRAGLGVSDGEFVFGYVGRLSPEKGVEHLVDAFASIAATQNHSRLLIVGDGPSRGALERRVEGHGTAAKVTFTGFQSDAAQWYSAMDAFVLPSLTEGTPMALLEAMAHRVPVIASAVGGVPAVVSHRENGLLVGSADPAELAAAMRTIASTPSLRETLSDAGVHAVRQGYDVGRWVRSIQGVYAESLGNGIHRQ